MSDLRFCDYPLEFRGYGKKAQDQYRGRALPLDSPRERPAEHFSFGRRPLKIIALRIEENARFPKTISQQYRRIADVIPLSCSPLLVLRLLVFMMRNKNVRDVTWRLQGV